MNLLKNLWFHHKVKILGILAIVFGTLQLQFEQIKELIPEKDRGFALVIFGALASIFGYINTNSNPPPPPPTG
jgi:hypothetical protein